MIGMTQHFLPPTSFWYSYPSPKKCSLTCIFSSALVIPLKTAVVGAVRTHSARRSTTCSLSFFLLAQIRIETPGLPSGVWLAGMSPSMPASQGHPIADVANPVASVAAFLAHSFVTAVMITRQTHVGNASAYVSSIVTPLIYI